MQVFEGRPSDSANRQEREIAVYNFLDGLGIRYQRVDHPAVNTMEECNAIDRYLAPTVVCKNLFLRNSRGDRFYLLMLRADKHFFGREIARQIASTRLSFATAEDMEKYLNIHPGAVSVMGLMNDSAKCVQLLVDEDVIAEPFVGCHPCVNTSSLRIKTEDVFKVFVPATGHNFTPVKCR